MNIRKLSLTTFYSFRYIISPFNFSFFTYLEEKENEIFSGGIIIKWLTL